MQNINLCDAKLIQSQQIGSDYDKSSHLEKIFDINTSITKYKN